MSSHSCDGRNPDRARCGCWTGRHTGEADPVVIHVPRRPVRSPEAPKAKRPVDEPDDLTMVGYLCARAPELWRAVLKRDVSLQVAYHAAQAGARTLPETR